MTQSVPLTKSHRTGPIEVAAGRTKVSYPSDNPNLPGHHHRIAGNRSSAHFYDVDMRMSNGYRIELARGRQAGAVSVGDDAYTMRWEAF